MNRVFVNIMQDPNAEDLPLPKYQTEGSAGMDLYAAVGPEGVLIRPGQWERIPTGISIKLPEGYEGQVRPRSGLSNKFAISMLNNPGTIDSDYTGQIFLFLINHGFDGYTVKRGDRVAQLVIAPVVRAEWSLVTSFPITDRGAGGFGSTGR